MLGVAAGKSFGAVADGFGPLSRKPGSGGHVPVAAEHGDLGAGGLA